MTSAFVVGRHRKGKDNEEVVQQVHDALRLAGWTVDSRLVTRKSTLERAAKRAVKDGCDVVVAVGGDGAVVRVASALAKTKAALGIIPTGTGNLLALNLGIPKKAEEATDVILSGRVRRIDMGRIETKGKTIDFAVAAGVGFDAEVVQKTTRSRSSVGQARVSRERLRPGGRDPERRDTRSRSTVDRGR